MLPQVYVAGRKVTEPYSDLVISHEWPASGIGGPASAQFTLLLKPAERPSWLVKDASAEVRIGGMPIVAGKLSEPDWTDGTMTIDGASREGSTTACLTTANLTTSTPDTAIDAAISRGAITWSRPASISTTALTGADQTQSLNNLVDMLGMYAQVSGSRLYVDASRRLLKASDPTAPEFVILPGAGELSWTTEAQASRIYGSWFDTSGNPHVTAVGSGTPERMVSWPPEARIDSATATAVLNSLLAQTTAGGWTGGLTLAASQFIGTPSLASIANAVGRGVMVRLLGQRDPRPDRPPVGYIDLVIERSEWNVAAGTITLTPRGMVARDWAALIAAAGLQEAS